MTKGEGSDGLPGGPFEDPRDSGPAPWGTFFLLLANVALIAAAAVSGGLVSALTAAGLLLLLDAAAAGTYGMLRPIKLALEELEEDVRQ